MHKFKCFFILLLLVKVTTAQELNARVTVNTTGIANNVNKKTFQTLEIAIVNFLNNRKWTSDTYLPNEKIDCSFLLNLQSTDEVNVYSANLTIQSARPIFNSTYVSPIINYQDKDVVFKYIEFQQLDFNDNRVSGSDAFVSNLTAVLAYYAYMIIAFDADSFSPRGGDIYFQRAQNIVNNAPEGRNITGWNAFDAMRNRYWLVENMQSSRYNLMHDIYYAYYRKALDKMYEDGNKSRAEMLSVLNLLNKFNTDNINTMINQFFFQGKSTELIKIFSKGTPQDKAIASELLQKLDITNAVKYKDELK